MPVRHWRRAPPTSSADRSASPAMWRASSIARPAEMSSPATLQRLRHRADAVVDVNVGVPQRVPEQFGDLRHHVARHVVVNEGQVQIGVRQQLAAAQAAGGDDGEPAGGRDADLGGLGGEPELVQIEQRVTQRRGVQSGAAGQQLFGCGRQILCRTRRSRRRRLPSRGSCGGIWCLLGHLGPPRTCCSITALDARPGDDA